MPHSKAGGKNPPHMVHGVFLEIFNKGVLLRGPSGSGKSDCALQLLDRNHRLIADDVIIFQKDENENLMGSCPLPLRYLLEVRGLGIIDVRSLYGSLAVLETKALDLILELTLPTTTDESRVRCVYPKLEKRIIMDLPFLHLTLSLAFTGNMAILIESAVKFAFTESKAQATMS